MEQLQIMYAMSAMTTLLIFLLDLRINMSLLVVIHGQK